MTSSVAGPRSSSKVLSKAKLAPKKKKVLCHRLVVCCQSDCSFLNPSRSVTSEKYAQQIRCAENCSTCSQHRWAERAVLHTTTPRHHLTSSFSQVGRIGYEVMPHPPHSPDLLPANHHLKDLDNCLQGKCFHNQQDAENAFQEFIKSWSTYFYTTGINKRISH